MGLVGRYILGRFPLLVKIKNPAGVAERYVSGRAVNKHTIAGTPSPSVSSVSIGRMTTGAECGLTVDESLHNKLSLRTTRGTTATRLSGP